MSYLYKYNQGLIDMFLFHVQPGLDSDYPGIEDANAISDKTLEALAMAWRPAEAKLEELAILHAISNRSAGWDGVSIDPLVPDHEGVTGATSLDFDLLDPDAVKNADWGAYPYSASNYADLFLCSDFVPMETASGIVYCQVKKDTAKFRHEDMCRRGLLIATNDLNSDICISFSGQQLLERPLARTRGVIDAFTEVSALKPTMDLSDEQQDAWEDFIENVISIVADYKRIPDYGYKHVSYERVLTDLYEMCWWFVGVNIPEEMKFDLGTRKFRYAVQKIWHTLFMQLSASEL